jgi:hypothetical protein
LKIFPIDGKMSIRTKETFNPISISIVKERRREREREVETEIENKEYRE